MGLPTFSRGSAAPKTLARPVRGMRTSYSLDLQQLLELLEDICCSDLEGPVQIARTADGGMEVYLAPENGKVLLQVDVVSLQGEEHAAAKLLHQRS